MTQAANDNIIQAFRVADLITVEDEPRVGDVLLAERLGMEHARGIRTKIKDNLPELALHGEIHTRPIETTKKGGRPGVAYYLNEAQALLLCMFANTKFAVQVRKMLIDVFMEWRRGRLPVAAPVPVLHSELESIAALVQDNIAKMERAVYDIRRAAEEKSRCLSAMFVNGEPVIVDVSDFDIGEGEEAVVINWDGKLSVECVRNYDGHRFAGERSAMTLFKDAGRRRESNGCVIIGKVVRDSYTQPSAPQQPVLAAPVPSLPAPKRRRPMDYKTYKKVHAMWTGGYSNIEIARELGLTYQMVQKRTVKISKYWKPTRLAHHAVA